MDGQVYLKDVVTLKLDRSKCIGCGMCVTVCPHAVFEVQKNKSAILRKNSCMECGACMRNCPVSAITVRSGVGCAAGIINGAVNGEGAECDCSCSGDGKKNKKSCC